MKDVMVVLVLYKQDLAESMAYNSLLEAQESFVDPFSLLIYDNSKTSSLNKKEINCLPFQTTFIHDKENSGLAYAYNKGLKLAIAKQKKWILLLDQDSCFDVTFLKELNRLINIDTTSKVAALIPHIIHKKKKISPCRVNRLGFMTPISKSFHGRNHYHITGLNTCTTIRIKFAQSINGFNPFYHLDMLDHWLFKEISNHNNEVYVMRSVIKHSLSLLENDYIDIARYNELLVKELAFKRSYNSSIIIFSYKMGLIYRALKQLLILKRPKHALKTLNHIFN